MAGYFSKSKRAARKRARQAKRRAAKEGGYTSYDTTTGTATYVSTSTGGGGAKSVSTGTTSTSGGGSSSSYISPTMSATPTITPTSTKDLRNNQIITLSTSTTTNQQSLRDKFKDALKRTSVTNRFEEERKKYREAMAERLTGYTSEDYERVKDTQKDISSDSISLQKKEEDLKKTQDRFGDDWKDFIKDDKFVGTESEYKVYKNSLARLNKKIEEYQGAQSRLELKIKQYETLGGKISDKGVIEMPTTKIGDLTIGKKVILKGREVPISKFEGLYSTTKVHAIDSLKHTAAVYEVGAKQMFFAGGEALGKGIGAGLTSLGIKKVLIRKEKEIEEKQIEKLHHFTPKRIYNIMKGNVFIKDGALTIPEYTRKEVSLTPTEFGTQVGKTTGDISSFGATTSKYFIPIAGATLYAGEVGGSIYESGGVGKWIKEKPLEAALTGAVIVGGAAFAGAKWLKTPITRKIPSGYRITTRADEFLGARVRVSKRGVSLLPSKRYLKEVTREVVRKPEVSFLEVGQKTMVDGKVIQKTYPVIVEQPAIVKETTLFSKLGKKKFKETVSEIIHYKYKQPKITSPFADKLLVGDKPFVLRTQRVGKSRKLGEPKYTFINQEGKFVQFGDISKLDEVQKYALLKTLEKGKLGGRPIKQKDILKYLTEEEQIQMGVSKGLVITKPIGKQTSMFEKVAIVKEGKPMGDIKVYDIVAGAKDISKPYSRAIGDVSLIKGKYLELPTIDKTTSEITKIISTSGKRTLLSSTFELQKVQALKYIPKKPTLPKPTIKQTMIPEPIVYDKQLPYMVGGTGIQTSQYTGTGLYEVQEGISVSPTQLRGTIQPQFIEAKQIDIQVTKPSSISSFKPLVEQLEETKLKIDTKPTQEFIQPVKEVVKESQLFKQSLKLKQQLKQDLLIKQAQALKQTQVVKVEPFKFKPIFKLGDAISKVKAMAKEKPKEFKIFVTKFGEEVEIGTRKTKKEAEKLLKKELFGTLRAGGGIKVGGKKLKAEDIELGLGFMKSKIDPFKIIEKKERRLKRGTQEVPELLFFKSKKKGLKKKKSIFGL